MQLTDELKVVVAAEVERAIQNFEKLNGSVDKAEKKTQKLGKAIDKIAGKAAIFSAALAGTGIAAIKLAGDLEQTQLALEVLLGDAEQATRIKNEWTQLASSTPFSSSDIDSAGKKLLAFNIEAEKVTDTLRRIGDISAATGSSISDIADIYGKAAVQGRLFAEDINQFQGRGIPVVQSLAKVLGVAETEVRDLVTQGKVGFPELEAAFKNMTDEGGQFSGMMDKLSQSTLGKFSTTMDNAKLALASFGDVLLPTANDFLDSANGFFQGIQNLDEGTKRFLVTFGGIVAASGPVILAVNGINAAFAALAANPMILAIAGAVAGVALLGAGINTLIHADENYAAQTKKTASAANNLLSAFAEGNTAKKLDASTTQELIKLYPELSGEISAYATTVEEAARKVEELYKKKIVSQVDDYREDFNKQKKKVLEYSELIIKEQNRINQELEAARKEGIQEGTLVWDSIARGSLKDYNRVLADSEAKIEDLKKTANSILAPIKKMVNEDFEVVDIPVEIKPEVETGEFADDLKSSLDSETPKAIKTRQEWFDEITGVDKSLFTTGAQAGKLYAEGLAAGLEQSQNIAKALGKDFNLSESIKSQMEQIEGDIAELLAIPADEIESQFALTDNSIQKLIATYKDLEVQAKKADVAETLTDLQTQVDNLGKSEADLTLETLEANGATEEQIERAKELLALLANDETALSWQDKITVSLEKALTELNLFSEETNKVLADLGTQMLSITFDSALTGFSEFGKALAEGQSAAESLGQALAAMSQQILQQLPTMFLQAGLQLIAQGQWALGLGFIAAAGTTAIIGGYVEGKTGEAEENAKGGVYGDGGYRAFAKGGAFTNSIVDRPTFFKFARGGGFGTGLMGEAGPEAIMPLKRGSDGTLGVSVSGQTGFAIQVVINNYSSEKITAEEKTDMDGQRKLEITVGAMINQHISGGKADKALGSRYGLKAQGV